MLSVDARRKLTKNAVDINSSPIVLHRTVRIPDGVGGWLEDQVQVLSEQNFRIYLSSESTQEIAHEGGSFQLKTWEMLCLWDADIEKSDTFEFDGNVFTVVSVRPVRLKGELVSKQAVVAEAEEVKIQESIVDPDDPEEPDDGGWI